MPGHRFALPACPQRGGRFAKVARPQTPAPGFDFPSPDFPRWGQAGPPEAPRTLTDGCRLELSTRFRLNFSLWPRCASGVKTFWFFVATALGRRWFGVDRVTHLFSQITLSFPPAGDHPVPFEMIPGRGIPPGGPDPRIISKGVRREIAARDPPRDKNSSPQGRSVTTCWPQIVHDLGTGATITAANLSGHPECLTNHLTASAAIRWPPGFQLRFLSKLRTPTTELSKFYFAFCLSHFHKPTWLRDLSPCPQVYVKVVMRTNRA